MTPLTFREDEGGHRMEGKARRESSWSNNGVDNVRAFAGV